MKRRIRRRGFLYATDRPPTSLRSHVLDDPRARLILNPSSVNLGAVTPSFVAKSISLMFPLFLSSTDRMLSKIFNDRGS